jgi:carbonic anhydrase
MRLAFNQRFLFASAAAVAALVWNSTAVSNPPPSSTHDEHEALAATPKQPAPKNTGPSTTPSKRAAANTDETPAKRSVDSPKKDDAPLAEIHTAAEAMQALQEGNARWVSGSVIDPNIDTSRRSRLAAEGQKPFVTVLTCADSRMPVERVFDRGVGEIFVIRVAGAVAGTHETGTIEYGVGHLKTPLVVVMGHTKCGAVAAAASNAELHGNVAQLVAEIGPAVDRARRNNPDADEKQLASLAVRENVWQSIFDLFKNSPELRTAAGKGEVKVVGAVCDIATGKVEWMGEHPWQTELIDAMNARTQPRETAAAPVEH